MPERFGCLVRGTDAAGRWRVGTRQSLNLWKGTLRFAKECGAALSTLLPWWEKVARRARRMRGLYPRRQTPHPSRTRCTRPCHPLPQGEREEESLLPLLLPPHRLRRIRLCQRMRFCECRQRHRGFENAFHGRIRRKIDLLRHRRVDMADHADVGECRRISMAKPPGGLVAGQMRFDRGERFDGPMAAPCLLLCV